MNTLRSTPFANQTSMPLFTLPFPAFDPVLISIGPIEVRWYALAYICGILFGWLYARAIVGTESLWGGQTPIKAVDCNDVALWVTLGVILGGRLGYVLFYNPAYFAAHPLEIGQIWTGGMSFHGGAIGSALAAMLFARRRGISMLSLTDVICAVGPIGLLLGRIANFINGELWGRPTHVPWAMVFPSAGPLPRHPSQLYEATLEGLMLFGIGVVLLRVGALTRPGLITGAIMLAYGVARIICEFFREPDPEFGFLWGELTMGMLLSMPMILAGIVFIGYALRSVPLRRA